MTGPIHEMTRNNHQREPLPFAPISRHEKVKEPVHTGLEPRSVV